MKILARCFVLVIVPMLAGCKGELVSAHVNLAADGSGDCEIAGIRDVQVGEKGGPGGVLEGVTDASTSSLQIQTTRANFASIKDLKIGDVSFALEKQDGRNLLTVRIPATADSKWFAAFGVPQRTADLWTRTEEQTKKDNEARLKKNPKAERSGPEPSKPPNVLFGISLPGKLEGQAFETVPLGLSTKIETDRGKESASLRIPLADVHGGKIKEVVWKISYVIE